MTTGNDDSTHTAVLQQADAWPPGQLSIFGVIDQLGADFYVGKALEYILGHREDTQGFADDLQSAIQMLDQKRRRLMAAQPAGMGGTGSRYSVSVGGGGRGSGGGSGAGGGNGTPG
jgi:hypothetical protein